MHHLEAEGIMTSVGSACQAKKGEASPALAALGLRPEEAKRVLRISFSKETNTHALERVCTALRGVQRALTGSTSAG